jgi:hypothetical protein
MDPYALAVLSDGPLGYWRFGGDNGVVAQDASGNKDCTYVGSVGLDAPGAAGAGSGARFSGAGHVDCGDFFDFPGTAPHSIEAWVRPEPPVEGKPTTVAGKLSSTPRGYRLFVFDVQGVRWRRYDAGVAASAAGPVLPSTSYSHIVGTWDGSVMTLYVNGKEVDESMSSLPLADTSAPFVIGDDSESNSPFEGDIDEVAVYGKALALDQIQAHLGAK